jgi:hypothetical protein
MDEGLQIDPLRIPSVSVAVQLREKVKTVVRFETRGDFGYSGARQRA